MRNLIFSLCCLASLSVCAQVPYFAGTVGDGKVYGYTSIKIRPGVKQIESYNTFQFGLGANYAIGADIYSSGDATYYGLLGRVGYKISPYFNIGGQVTPSFDLSSGFSLSYITAAIYANGNITSDGKFFWVSNSWYGYNRHSSNTIDQWLYLGYGIGITDKVSITPMAGCLYSWKFDKDADMSIGAYLSYKKFNFYLWGNDFFENHPRIVLGLDFAI